MNLIASKDFDIISIDSRNLITKVGKILKGESFAVQKIVEAVMYGGYYSYSLYLSNDTYIVADDIEYEKMTGEDYMKKRENLKDYCWGIGCAIPKGTEILNKNNKNSSSSENL